MISTRSVASVFFFFNYGIIIERFLSINLLEVSKKQLTVMGHICFGDKELLCVLITIKSSLSFFCSI